MGKNVAVFVDVANVFYAAKAAGVDIDYVTLLKSVTAGRDLVRAYAYTGLDPDNENQRNFHDFLRRSGYKVVSKDIRKYGDGKVKANLDIELVVDMMKTARNLDIAIVVSGDGDFAPAIRAVQEQGVRVEVLSFRGNTSSDLMDVADLFTDIAQIAKVEKGSSRSGRRVASDDDDLSMTEVPDKQSEGTGRGRGRGRSRAAEREPVAESREVAATPRPRSRARTAAPVDEAAVAAVTSGGMALVALPGEKLSKAVPAPAAIPMPVAEDAEDHEEAEDLVTGDPAVDGEEEPRRRRRRRGGRGRGRGRAHEGVATADGTPGELSDDQDDEDSEEDVADLPPARIAARAPAKRPVHTFGSVWDSQLGTPAPSSGPGPILDDEDLDEPPIPEYLIAERRQGGGRGGPSGGRGGAGAARGSYAAAMERERYGGGRSGGPSRSSGPSRFSEPSPRGGNREPDRSRGDRPMVRPAARIGNPDEPWSEVPPEIEAMLRAQIGSRPAVRPTQPVVSSAPPAEVTVEPEAGATAPKRRATREPAGAKAPVAAVETATPATETATPKRRTIRKVASTAEATKPAGAAAAPKRRVTRKAAEPAD